MTQPDIDALARLLDGDLPEGEATVEARALNAFAKALEATARPATSLPPMEHKADMRAMLVEAARAQAASPTVMARMRNALTDTTSRWRYSMRTAAATGVAAMALSTGGVALAAHRSLPSDPFYGVKLTLEDIRLAFIGDDLARGQQLMDNAYQRLDEAQWAASEGDMPGAARALHEADDTGRTAAGYIIRASQDREDPSLLNLLTEFAEAQRKQLAALIPALEGDARSAAEDAMVSLRRINQRVAILAGPCSQCGTDGGGTRESQGGKSGAKGDKGKRTAAADEDFDMSVIPPASEPFSPCDCVTGGPTVGGKDVKGTKRGVGEGKKKDPTIQKPPVDKTPGDDPAPTDPTPPDGPGEPNPPEETDPLPTVPVEEGEETKDSVRKAIEEIIDLPPPPEPTPLPTPVPPQASAPSPGAQLP
jgi:hypothetical protein